MPYIDTKYLFKCETCRNFRNNVCRTFCESGEGYSPSMDKIPTADVAPRAEVAAEIFDDINDILAAHAYRPKSEDYAAGACDTLEWFESQIDELKKKYTEGQTDVSNKS